MAAWVKRWLKFTSCRNGGRDPKWVWPERGAGKAFGRALLVSLLKPGGLATRSELGRVKPGVLSRRDLFGSAPHLPAVPRGHVSVRNGDAGRPAVL